MYNYSKKQLKIVWSECRGAKVNGKDHLTPCLKGTCRYYINVNHAPIMDGLCKLSLNSYFRYFMLTNITDLYNHYVRANINDIPVFHLCYSL